MLITETSVLMIGSILNKLENCWLNSIDYYFQFLHQVLSIQIGELHDLAKTPPIWCKNKRCLATDSPREAVCGLEK